MSSGLALEAEGGRWNRYPAYKDSGVEWLGAVPEGWEVKRLKHLCSYSALYGANEPSTAYVGEGVRFLRTTDITDKGELLPENAVFLEIEQVKDYLLEDGDLLISRSGTIGRSFVHDASKHGQCAYAGYLVRFVLNDELYPRFAFYYTKTDRFSKYLSMSVIQSTIGNVNGQKYANMPLPTPPIPEQHAIATFLDHETRRIDTLVAKKERQIELLQEKRTALISHAVTKGLDPDAPMKDSGVEWLGEVPEHWNIVHLKRVFHSTDYGISESLQADGVYGILRMGDIQDGEILMDDLGYVDSVAQELLLDQGDLVFNRTNSLALVGKVGIFRGTIEDNISFASYLVRLRIKDTSDPEYFNYMLNRPEVLSKASSMALPSIGQANLNPNRYGYLRICAPPKKEQYEIARFLRDKTCKIDRLKEKINGSISKLREYRTALISAAVTGKIDVREESAP